MFNPDDLFKANPGLTSRSISFENPTGEPGAGGRAASPLGPGRKGDPARVIEAGARVTLAEITGPGTIRHIWMTTFPNPKVLRGVMVRCYWEASGFASVEMPLSEFFGFAHGATPSFQSAIHSVGPRYGMNSYMPMPFVQQARIELVNETPKPIWLFYQVDYTLGDDHAADVLRLHGWFSRQNPTSEGRDFELLPARKGAGRFLGSVIGIRPLADAWWGEGEVKFYMDGDDEFATIVGTGSEDYVGLSWGIQQAPFLYHGANRVDAEETDNTGPVSMYRWHIPDPVYWHEQVRVTIQQIGHAGQPGNMEQYKANLFERSDDWSTGTYWYSADLAPLPPGVDYETRVAELTRKNEQTKTGTKNRGQT